jgi:hypothetical protein
MHSMELAYSKDNEGGLYPNSITSGSSTLAVGNTVSQGGYAVYKGLVNDGAAPYPGTDSQA